MADSCGATVGVSAVPEIKVIDVDSSRHKFIVLGSDGLWEFIGNDEVGQIVKPFSDEKNAEGAGETLVKEAYKRWRERSDVQIDDITTVILFLK